MVHVPCKLLDKHTLNNGSLTCNPQFGISSVMQEIQKHPHYGTKSQAQLREMISLLMASLGVITEGLGGKLSTIGIT